ncbi:DUF262 domain-containing protein [Aeromonas dhakensis]|uniref:DUF262 domain-containing protein n=1 Tax=Aeromonas dhakensis TaxID=196024 RepID=UPI00244A1660|nr:DUF262 domain-containing protein [Aeromonas dhakensis]MDH0348200.1 DUF262 domain-containing protein [Aeromonas dhakensis]
MNTQGKAASRDRSAYDDKNAFISRLIKPLPEAHSSTDASFRDIELILAGYQENYGLNLNPDFQRGHVWTKAQRVAFIEGLYRGTVGESQRIIQFNAPYWGLDKHEGDLPNEVQIVDGLQRLTTVRLYVADELKIFGGLRASDFNDSRYSVKMSNWRLRFNIHTFIWRHELLRYYLDINSGGTPHSKAELERVRALLKAADTTAQGE